MKKLFEKTDLAKIKMKNRFVRSATWENMADEKGHMTAKLENVYTTLADGGIGLIITGFAHVIEDEQPVPGMMGIYDDTFIEEYSTLTDKMHERNCPIVLQIAYGGSQTSYKPDSRTIWGPSAVEHPVSGITPKKMTLEEINILIDSFADAAHRARESGFDGVQIHGAHGYLLNQFLSPYFNRRLDRYGGCIKDRSIIFLEILDKIKDVCGKKYPTMIKLNCSDFAERGATVADCMDLCKLLDEHKIDSIEISGGVSTTKLQESHYAPYAAEIAEHVKSPIMLVGNNRRVETMQSLLESTQIDYFSLSRCLLNDPGIIKRWKNGEFCESGCTLCGKCFHDDGNRCIVGDFQ